MSFFKVAKKSRINMEKQGLSQHTPIPVDDGAERPEARQALPVEQPVQDPALRRRQSREDLNQLLHSPHGLRYLGRLVAMSGALAPSYSASCAYATAYNEGLRRMGLLILAEAEEIAPETLPRLLMQGLAVPKSGSPLQ